MTLDAGESRQQEEDFMNVLSGCVSSDDEDTNLTLMQQNMSQVEAMQVYKESPGRKLRTNQGNQGVPTLNLKRLGSETGKE